jgi:hypothetical protein
MFWRSDDKTSVLSGCKIAKALIVDDREREVGQCSPIRLGMILG